MGLFDIFRRGPARPSAPPAPAPAAPRQRVELSPAEPPVVTAAAIDCAHRVVDQLRLLHPAADGEISVIAECDDGAMRIASMEVARVGDHALPDCVVVDPFLHTAFLAGEVGRLLAALDQPTTGWLSLSLRAERDRLALLGATLPIEEPRLWYGDGFMTLLRDADPAIGRRQDALQRAMTALGPCSISWERDEGVVRLTPEHGAPVRIRAEVLGSFSPERSSWCWAWANASFESRHTRGVTALRDRAEGQAGRGLLRTPGCDCSEPFAFAIAYLAAQSLGERPIWRWPLASGVQLFFAMVEEAGWLR